MKRIIIGLIAGGLGGTVFGFALTWLWSYLTFERGARARRQVANGILTFGAARQACWL